MSPWELKKRAVDRYRDLLRDWDHADANGRIIIEALMDLASRTACRASEGVR